jgi:Pentapeptide repeats (8 copies)
MDRRGIAKRIALLTASSILLLFVYIPMVSANVQDETTVHAHPMIAISVPGTPTVDPTLTALQKEQLTEQINQQQHDPQNWFWYLITASFSTLILVVGGLYAFLRWLWDRRDARKKQAEERFESIVDGLGGETTETKIASAVLLHTFLRPEYKEYYTQVFDLAVANLRIPEHAYSSTTKSSDISSQIITALLNAINKQTNEPTEETQESGKAKSSEAVHSLRQALITVFRDAFPRARDRLTKQNRMQRRFIIILENLFRVLGGSRTTRIRLAERDQRLQFKRQYLDASDIQLDSAFLFRADLRQAYMPEASLRNADLSAARLSEIILRGADLTCANLDEAKLTGADLTGADLTGANLTGANLTGAYLKGARYNTEKVEKKDEKEQPIKDKQGNPVMIGPTQWPQKFDPKTAGATVADGSNNP